jgi:hypothetical protein
MLTKCHFVRMQVFKKVCTTGRSAFLQKIVRKNQSKISHVGRGDLKCVKLVQM